MSDFNALKFVADNAGLNIFKALEKAYEHGKADAAKEALIDKDINVPSKWIPVSERLPQSDPEDLEYPTVIICSPNGSIELGCFYESTKEWGTGEGFDRLINPVAWMPLPEPWKGEG